MSIALVASTFLVAQLVFFQFGRDQGIYAVVADGMLSGRPPYLGTWDFKPPGVYFVYALAQTFFGRGIHAVRYLEVVGIVLLLVAFAILSKRHVGDWRPGVLGGALAVLTYVQLEFWNTGQPSSFAGVLLAWALVFATYEPREVAVPSWAQQLSWLASGAAFSAAALMKPPLGGGIAVSATIVAIRAAQRGQRGDRVARAAGALCAFGIGAALPIALVAVYFVRAGAWQEMIGALFVFAPQYTALGLSGHRFDTLLLQAVEQWAIGFGLTSAAGLILLIVLPALHRREREALLHVAGAVAFILVGVALQAKFFHYHYAAALALTALCAGWGLWKLWIHLRRRLIGVACFIVILAGLVSARSASESAHMQVPFFRTRCQMRLESALNPEAALAVGDRLYSHGDMDAGANRRLVEWLKAHTTANDSVFIWGFEPAVYFLADRKPASRYIYNVPQRAIRGVGESREILLGELERSSPRVIVVERGDSLPWVTGDRRDSSETLEHFPALLSFISGRYAPGPKLDRFDLYVRNDAQQPEQATANLSDPERGAD